MSADRHVRVKPSQAVEESTRRCQHTDDSCEATEQSQRLAISGIRVA